MTPRFIDPNGYLFFIEPCAFSMNSDDEKIHWDGRDFNVTMTRQALGQSLANQPYELERTANT